MNSPKWMFAPACLALLLAAVAAQAGEISMDVRGLAVGAQASSSEDAPAQTSQSTADVAPDEMPASHQRRWRMASPGTTNPGLADDAGIMPDTTVPSTGSNVSPTPAKSRNRWQSLVPGAIR